MIEVFTADSTDDGFFSAAYDRVVRNLLVLLPSAVVLLWVFFNHRFAMGFLVGGAVSVINFLSLKKLVIAFADRVIQSGGKQRSSGLALRFLLRYGLIAIAAYAIFKSSAMSAYGLVTGLGLPAAAIMIEAAYELYGSMRRKH